MSQVATHEFWTVFNARRVKALDLRGPDAMVSSAVGWVQNRRPILARLEKQAQRIELLEPEIHNLSSARLQEEVAEHRAVARVGKLKGPALDRGMAIVREGCFRAIAKRPFLVQIIGALAMCEGYVTEMATGEGKTITASLTASLWGWAGKPVHIITVNDYLVERDAEEMGPTYRLMGLNVGHVVHETDHGERPDHYRRPVVYCTQKELVADFLRDQIAMGALRNAPQTSVMALRGNVLNRLLVPGLFRVIVDEADSVLIDEAVTPLIISNSPDDEPNSEKYHKADELAQQLQEHRDYKIDWTVRSIELTPRGQRRLEILAGDDPFWSGKRRREELVTQAITGRYCFMRDEQYLVIQEESKKKPGVMEDKVVIIDEFTGRVMADRSWRHGLHQAIEVKEAVKVTADKENLARLSFQRFFRQYPRVCGMTGTAWESRGEMWQIYRRAILRIPTNKPCIRKHLPTRMFDTMDQKWNAVVERIRELHGKGIPMLVGTRSVWASEELARRLTLAELPHLVLNANQTKKEAEIIAQAGQRGQITVATNMAGRGTDIKLAKGVADIGGLHVIATEPHGSGRVDRQLFGRAARQGDPGCAQMFCCAEDDLFVRHAKHIRRFWRMFGAKRLLKIAQWRAEMLARFNRKQVMRQDDYADEQLPF
jgi:preprotein translocase subunit SecA